MNEQIKKLLDRATVDAIDATKDAVDFLDNPVTKQQRQLQLEKFAELIVKECVGVVDDAKRGGSNEIWDNAVKFIRRDLQEHFGLEE
jgi:hypothetical protein